MIVYCDLIILVAKKRTECSAKVKRYGPRSGWEDRLLKSVLQLLDFPFRKSSSSVNRPDILILPMSLSRESCKVKQFIICLMALPMARKTSERLRLHFPLSGRK